MKKKVFLLLLVIFVLFSVAAEKKDWKVGISADYVQTIKDYWQTPGFSGNQKILYDVAISAYVEKDVKENLSVYGKLGSDAVGASYKFDKNATISIYDFFSTPFPVFLALGANYNALDLDGLPLLVGAEVSYYAYDGIDGKMPYSPNNGAYPKAIGRFFTTSLTVSTDFDIQLLGINYNFFIKGLIGKRSYLDNKVLGANDGPKDITYSYRGFTPTISMGLTYQF